MNTSSLGRSSLRPVLAACLMLIVLGGCTESSASDGASDDDITDLDTTSGDGSGVGEVIEDTTGDGQTIAPDGGVDTSDDASPDLSDSVESDSQDTSDAEPDGLEGDVEDGDAETTVGDGGLAVEVTPTDTATSLDSPGSGDADAALEDIVPPELDVPAEDIVPEADTAASAPWLLSIDNSTHTLQKVDTATAATTDICVLNTTQTYPSLTFSRFNGLYGSRDGSQLDRIDPCSCAITPIGFYGAYSGVYGITADKSDNLFGVATVQDWLISISTESGQGGGLGALGYDFTTSGATWSDADGTLYAINGGTDGLYTVDPLLGNATLLSTLNYDFGTVGIELHPTDGVIYACSSSGHLLSVDPNGQVTDIGDMNQGGSCTNLAAPWLAVPCLEGI